MFRKNVRFILYSRFVSLFAWLSETLFEMLNVSNQKTRIVWLVTIHINFVDFISYNHHWLHFSSICFRWRIEYRDVCHLQIHEAIHIHCRQKNLICRWVKNRVNRQTKCCWLKYIENHNLESRSQISVWYVNNNFQATRSSFALFNCISFSDWRSIRTN